MTAVTSGSGKVALVTDKRSPGMQLIRNIVVYTAIGIAVSAGGVLVGAMVLAPAVSRATPYFSGNVGNAESSGAIGQADGDGAAAAAASANSANAVATEQFKPIAESIAAAKQAEAAQSVSAARRPWYRSAARQAGFMIEDTVEFLKKMPTILWVVCGVALVSLLSLGWFYRFRMNGTSRLSTAPKPFRPSAAVLPTKLAAGKGSRTPKAVAALAEAGTPPVDIARHTGLPLDAVAMLLSLGTLNARQLQPPTA